MPAHPAAGLPLQGVTASSVVEEGPAAGYRRTVIEVAAEGAPGVIASAAGGVGSYLTGHAV